MKLWLHVSQPTPIRTDTFRISCSSVNHSSLLFALCIQHKRLKVSTDNRWRHLGTKFESERDRQFECMTITKIIRRRLRWGRCSGFSLPASQRPLRSIAVCILKGDTSLCRRRASWIIWQPISLVVPLFTITSARLGSFSLYVHFVYCGDRIISEWQYPCFLGNQISRDLHDVSVMSLKVIRNKHVIVVPYRLFLVSSFICLIETQGLCCWISVV